MVCVCVGGGGSPMQGSSSSWSPGNVCMEERYKLEVCD